MAESDLSIVVLAAGRGTRMRNNIRKVLHPLAGRPLIEHVLSSAKSLDPSVAVMVLAPDMDDVFVAAQRIIPHAQCAIQAPPQGTGHAVKMALPHLPDTGYVAVVFGDTPLLTGHSLRMLADHARESQSAVAVMGMRPTDATGYGRLKIEDGQLSAIVEHAHADEELRANAMCNSGVMVIDAACLPTLINELPLVEGKNEYYLTDCVALSIKRGWRCSAIEAPWEEGLGVNSQVQLAEANRLFQNRAREKMMNEGVIMHAPDTVFVSFDTDIEPGVEIEPFVQFGTGVAIGSGSLIRSHSHIEGAVIGENCVVGPFARTRPGTRLGNGCRIGNFVETKNAVFGDGSKANHLSYIGDSELGTKVNVGAGTITCNYDGFNKHKTRIGNDVFVGSNTAFVAPIEIGDGAIIGAGSTITRTVPDDSLALERSEQVNKQGMAARLRRKLSRSGS